MRKTNGAEKLLVGGPAVTQKCVWVASDGTEFTERKDAVAYEEIMQNPHYKKLKEKVEQLERTVEHLQHDLLMERSKNPFRDVALNQRRNPQVPYYSGGPNA